MMKDETSRAIERMRSVDLSYMPVYPGGQRQFDDDCRVLAAAYIEDHPADDQTLVTPQWMEEIGLIDSFNLRNSKRYEICEGVRVVFVACDGPKCWQSGLWVGKKINTKEVTRGDVRRLLLILGT